tara:strand:+ start:358 stop:609 length:252 start_codon:yes stop_codon:yes gene_type:complete
MINIRKNIIPFIKLTEDKKDDILKYIREKEISIKNAALDLNVTSDTINKIFTERFGKRTRTEKSVLNTRKEYHKKYWIENKLK